MIVGFGFGTGLFLLIKHNSYFIHRRLRKTRWKITYYKLNKNKGTNITEDKKFTDCYIYIRIMALLLWVILVIKYRGVNIFLPISLVALYIITMPVEKIAGINTIYKKTKSLYFSYKRNQLEYELFRLSLYLKNILLGQKTQRLSEEYTLTELLTFSKELKPAFTQIISLKRLGKNEEAEHYLKNIIQTDFCHNFSNLLSKMAYLDIDEMVGQLKLMQETYRQKRFTQKTKNIELVSDLLYGPIMVTAVIVLVNFVVIVVWMDAINVLNTL